MRTGQSKPSKFTYTLWETLVALTTLLVVCDSTLVLLESTSQAPPYGVYVLKSKWGCDLMKDSRCDQMIAIDSTGNLMLDSTIGDVLEFIENEDSTFLIKVRKPCAEESESLVDSAIEMILGSEKCLKDHYLSVEGDQVRLSKDFPANWLVVRRPGDLENQWMIQSTVAGEFKGYALSFDANNALKLIEEKMYWELFLDTSFVTEQRLEKVQFNQPGLIILEESEVVLASKEVHNLGDVQVTTKYELEYLVSESEHLVDWSGFVLPMTTEYLVPDVLLSSDRSSVTLTDEVTYTSKWGTELLTDSANKISNDVALPPNTFKLVQVFGTRVTFSLPFNGKVLRKFDSDVVVDDVVNGIMYSTEVVNIHVKVGDAVLIESNVDKVETKPEDLSVPAQ